MKLRNCNRFLGSGTWDYISVRGAHVPADGFTLVEVALALAVIGFALVAIIGVLPLGMNVQRENREETIINHDAMVLIEAIRTSAKGFDELTNYVDAVWVSNVVMRADVFGEAQTQVSGAIVKANVRTARELIGLFSTPTRVSSELFEGRYVFVTNTYVIVHMRALTGNAADKPPQANKTLLEGAFSYRLETQLLQCFAPDVTAVPRFPIPNLYELRLTFRWPLLPNGRTGRGFQRFQTRVSGTLTGPYYWRQQQLLRLYFFDPGVYVQSNQM